MKPLVLERKDAEEVAEYWVKKYGDLLNTNRELQEENKSLRDAIVHMSQLMANLKSTIDGMELAMRNGDGDV